MVGLFVGEALLSGPRAAPQSRFLWACLRPGYFAIRATIANQAGDASSSAQSEGGINVSCEYVHSVSAESPWALSIALVISERVGASAVRKFRCNLHLCDQTAIGAEKARFSRAEERQGGAAR